MYVVLLTLIVLDLAALAVGVTLGITLHSGADVNRHYLMGLFVSMFTCFIHCLVLFYLIGTGKDVRDAVEDVPELAARFVPWTREQKRRAFPAACFAIVLMIVAALMGGEVHSRLLAAPPRPPAAAVADGATEVAAATREQPTTLPLRGIPFWWVHAAFVAAAVVSSAYAFRVEVRVVRENRRVIQLLNEELAS